MTLSRWIFALTVILFLTSSLNAIGGLTIKECNPRDDYLSTLDTKDIKYIHTYLILYDVNGENRVIDLNVYNSNENGSFIKASAKFGNFRQIEINLHGIRQYYSSPAAYFSTRSTHSILRNIVEFVDHINTRTESDIRQGASMTLSNSDSHIAEVRIIYSGQTDTNGSHQFYTQTTTPHQGYETHRYTRESTYFTDQQSISSPVTPQNVMELASSAAAAEHGLTVFNRLPPRERGSDRTNHQFQILIEKVRAKARETGATITDIEAACREHRNRLETTDPDQLAAEIVETTLGG